MGILADPRFAWLCGFITTASIVLTVAKTTFDWPGRLKYATEMVEKYGRISGKYQLLIEDLNYRQVFNAELDDAFKKLREEELDFARDDYPKLKVELQEAIQDAIRKRINYGKWWKPDDSAAADTPAKA